MGIRKNVEEVIEGVFWVVNWMSSGLASDDDVEARVDDPAGNESSGESAEVWSIAGVQSRPTDGSEADGYAKALRVQLGDTVLIIGTHDPRHVEACEPGELLIHALGKTGASRALIRLKPNGVVEVAGTSIVLGEGAVNMAAVAELVDERLGVVRARYNSHTHVETGGTTDAPIVAMQIPALGSVAASKVKVE